MKKMKKFVREFRNLIFAWSKCSHVLLFCAVFGVIPITQNVLAIFGKIRVLSSMAILSQLCLSDIPPRSGNRRLSILPPGSIHPLKGDLVGQMYSEAVRRCSTPHNLVVLINIRWNCSVLRRRNNTRVVRLWCVSSTTHASFHFIFNFQFPANCLV